MFATAYKFIRFEKSKSTGILLGIIISIYLIGLELGIAFAKFGTKVTVIDAGAAAAKLEQGAQEASQRRAELLKNLTPEQREKLSKMGQEERRAYIRSLREARAAQGPASAASAAASH